jgi:hypothetical protein
MFKKIRYGVGSEIVKIKIEDGTGGLKENWTIMMSDLAKFVKRMSQKYHIEGMKKDKDSDLDWAI